MKTLRRLGIIVAGTAIASAVASASPVITYGTDPSTGNQTVTQTITFPSAGFPVIDPTALATFEGFAALQASLGSLTGDTYVAGDTTLDYQFTDTVSQFQVTNNDTQTDNVNFGLTSTAALDSGTSIGNTDRKSACAGIGNPAVNPAPFLLNQNCQGTFAPVNVMNQALEAGQTYIMPGLPIVSTVGICANTGGAFGTVNATGGGQCADSLTNDALYSGSSTNVSFGITDATSYSFSSAAAGSNTNLQFQSTTAFTGEAEITYEFTGAAPTPEPTTMVLLGSALVGLGLLRKRARQ